MSDIQLSVSLPLDDDGYFRRECPLCVHEFKVLPEKGELEEIAQKGIKSFLAEDAPEPESEDVEESVAEMTCPYCGQKAHLTSWWTQEQLAYMRMFAKNIMAKMINEQVIRPMRQAFRGSNGLFSLQFNGSDMEQETPWISPENNDMVKIDLPCCGKKIKIDEDWKGETIHCIRCGFPHQPSGDK